MDEQIMDIYMEAAAMKLTPKQFLDNLKSALYQRLAAEAVDYTIDTDKLFPMPGDTTEKAVPLSKLKAIMEIKDEKQN